ncbi:hypothetical protein POVWA2_003200 [Plasmodium ovale wallikeri]|uniref:Uncharacterized protein n=1 Tax=Plasmodium ovale wallikeri TaxID=864142 RepID=A0A1A8YGF4_PLAOA|nr:hypothetical protein POVWA1_003010 [Plasmodium ovale wallikeri]SBT31254.1 hypothetical protein POVWA2_003200 [Plasmodium ovale wallikeri]
MNSTVLFDLYILQSSIWHRSPFSSGDDLLRKTPSNLYFNFNQQPIGSVIGNAAARAAARAAAKVPFS